MQAVAGKLSSSRIAKFAALDCRAHTTLCERHGVAGTPAIQAVVPDADETAEFIGTISPAELKAWTLRQVPSHVTALRGQKDLNAFLEVRVLCMLCVLRSRGLWYMLMILLTPVVSPQLFNVIIQFLGIAPARMLPPPARAVVSTLNVLLMAVA